MITDVRPLQMEPGQLQGWRERPSMPYRLARFWATNLPRGKGWFPRLIGRWFGNRIRHDLTRTASGAKLAVDPRSLDVYCAIDRSGGRFDPEVLDTCCRLLRPGDVFYDIGANVGLMSMDVYARFGGQVRVYAFEPQPSLARSVAISAALNGFNELRVLQLMLGPAEADAKLYVPAHSLHASANPTADAEAVPCRMVTLDQLVRDGILPPPNVIKMDVEGFEWDVLHGGEDLLSTHRPSIVFEAGFGQRRSGYTRRDLCDYLRKLGGYDIYALVADKLAPIEQHMDDPTVNDLLAVRPAAAKAMLSPRPGA